MKRLTDGCSGCERSRILPENVTTMQNRPRSDTTDPGGSEAEKVELLDRSATLWTVHLTRWGFSSGATAPADSRPLIDAAPRSGLGKEYRLRYLQGSSPIPRHWV